jgi:hypothetical protein
MSDEVDVVTQLRNRISVHGTRWSDTTRHLVTQALDELERLREVTVLGTHDNALADAPRTTYFASLSQPELARKHLKSALDGGYWLRVPNMERAVTTVLDELDRLRSTPQSVSLREAVTPEPGLVYADPQGNFECTPADSAWTGEYLSLLELRVMRAHLLTALDNTNKALREKGSVTQ